MNLRTILTIAVLMGTMASSASAGQAPLEPPLVSCGGPIADSSPPCAYGEGTWEGDGALAFDAGWLQDAIDACVPEAFRVDADVPDGEPPIGPDAPGCGGFGSDCGIDNAGACSTPFPDVSQLDPSDEPVDRIIDLLVPPAKCGASYLVQTNCRAGAGYKTTCGLWLFGGAACI